MKQTSSVRSIFKVPAPPSSNNTTPLVSSITVTKLNQITKSSSINRFDQGILSPFSKLFATASFRKEEQSIQSQTEQNQDKSIDQLSETIDEIEVDHNNNYKEASYVKTAYYKPSAEIAKADNNRTIMSTDESNLSQNSIFKTVLFKSQQFNRFLNRKSDVSPNTNDENSQDINIDMAMTFKVTSNDPNQHTITGMQKIGTKLTEQVFSPTNVQMMSFADSLNKTAVNAPINNETQPKEYNPLDIFNF